MRYGGRTTVLCMGSNEFGQEKLGTAFTAHNRFGDKILGSVLEIDPQDPGGVEQTPKAVACGHEHCVVARRLLLPLVGFFPVLQFLLES